MQGGKITAPNCRFDGSVGVFASLAPSCRQCGNFCMPGTLAAIKLPNEIDRVCAEDIRE
jgi:hypothetical protein